MAHAARPLQATDVRREGATLVLGGVLDRAACAVLWKRVLPLLAGVDVLDLSAVKSVDSAGLALLAELADRNPGTTLVGSPEGLAELRAAYRLDDALGFAQ